MQLSQVLLNIYRYMNYVASIYFCNLEMIVIFAKYNPSQTLRNLQEVLHIMYSRTLELKQPMGETKVILILRWSISEAMEY